MTERDAALDRIAALAEEHGISAAEIAVRLEPAASDTAETQQGLLGRILAYLGGTFVFAGLGVFIALNWDEMNAAGRIVVTLGSGLAAFIMAIVAARDPRYERAATPLFLVAAALQPTGILVTLDEFSSGGNWRYAVLLTTAVMAAQQGAVFWKTRRNTLLFTTVAFALWFFATALDVLEMDWDWIAALLGLSMLGFCVGLEKTPHREVTPPFYLAAATGVYTGVFNIVEDTPLDLVLLLVAIAGLYVSVLVRRHTLLAGSTVAILAFVSYYTAEHFLDSLGWPLMLILLGIVLLLLSAMAVRINRRYLAQT